MINIKDDLRDWTIKYILLNIKNFHSDGSSAFNEWIDNFDEELARIAVDLEFINDWGYDEREEVDEVEAMEYAESIMQSILGNWHLL